MATDWFAKGHTDYPRYLPPQPGTDAEIEYCKGWLKGQREEQCDDKEWAFGRNTFFSQYDTQPEK